MGGILLKELGVYIHIPFCSSKCYYCDFVSFSNQDYKIAGYIDYLKREMDLYKEYLKDYTVKTIFIGGGTPSYLEGHFIVEILEHLDKNFNLKQVEEITIEANPGTLNGKKLYQYKGAGINRISLGVQSLNDRLLKSLGRSHTSMDFFRNYELIREMGFNNINVDLIFGLPDQTIEDCINTLKKVIDLGVEHISYYSLILEENTMMKKWYQEGRIQLPQEEIERQMYHRGIDLLKDSGYKHYEISNFSKEGFECKHNLFYWKLKPYIGLGIGAHSNISNKRFWNHSDFKYYYNSLDQGKVPISGEEIIDKDMEIAEYMILGLRLIKGINKKEFANRFKLNIEDIYKGVLDKHEKGGLLYTDHEWVRFTPKGLDLSNLVYVDLLP